VFPESRPYIVLVAAGANPLCSLQCPVLLRPLLCLLHSVRGNSSDLAGSPRALRHCSSCRCALMCAGLEDKEGNTAVCPNLVYKFK
jgi:hypothetical protein